MNIYKYRKDLGNFIEKKKKNKNSIGFVPTMGALHDGHLSLLQESKKISSLSVSSIFVNPTQFNNKEDLQKYPRTILKDIWLLENAGCDVLFLPDEEEIYPDAKLNEQTFHLGYLETILEGKFRPGHFQGVCQVVEKLLNIVNPDFLFLGQKDFQQCLVIKKLVSIMKKNMEIIICPVVREKNGLAMSSRNMRLNTSERQTASELYKCLINLKKQLTQNNFQKIKKEAINSLESKGFEIEYLELAKRKNLKIIQQAVNDEELVLLVAAHLGPVRLIDNVLINP